MNTQIRESSHRGGNEESRCSERGPGMYYQNHWPRSPPWHSYSSLGWCLLSFQKCTGAVLEIIGSNSEE